MRRSSWKRSVLGLALTIAGLCSSSHAVDRIVGANAPDGEAYLVKRFSVPAGSIVDGVEFISNDPATIFPRVVLLSGPVKVISTGLVEFREVMPVDGGHRVQLSWPPVYVKSTQELYVAVELPASTGIQEFKQGAGLLARELAPDEPRTSYFTSGADKALGPMDVDYRMELMFQGVGKASSGGTASDGSSAVGEEITSPLPRVPAVRLRPNPFNPTTTIELDVPRNARVKLQIYDITGRLTRALLDRDYPAGVHYESWDGRDESGAVAATGVYIARVKIGNQTLSQKLVLTK